MSELLEKGDLKDSLKKCPEWEIEKNSITRSFEFEEFMDGIDFVNNVGEIAEEAQHYPDITIKYTKVTLKLTTHDVGGVTELDIELAQRVDNLVDWCGSRDSSHASSFKHQQSSFINRQCFVSISELEN